jgi:hypothetical protein
MLCKRNNTDSVGTNVNTELCSCNHCCHRKAVSITYSAFASAAQVIQHAKHMRHIILSSVACPALLYSSTLSHKMHHFQKKKKVIENEMYVLTYSTNFV